MEALRRASPVPMEIKPIAHDTDGFFSIKAPVSYTHLRGVDAHQPIGLGTAEGRLVQAIVVAPDSKLLSFRIAAILPSDTSGYFS